MKPEDLGPIRTLLRDLNFNLSKAFQSDYSLYGITLLQGRLLTTVELNGELTMGELADLLNMTPGNVSTLCKRLEKQGYLKRMRTTEDARIVHVKLTEQGKNTMEQINCALKKRFDSVSPSYQTEDLAIIEEGLRRLNQILAAVAAQNSKEENHD